MTATFWKRTAQIAVALALICPQISWSEGFTGAQFLEWSEPSQSSYFRSSLAMATFVAGRIDEDLATCLDDWFAGDQTRIRARERELTEAIARNAEFHPSAVIMLYLEQECGSFAR